MQRIKNLRAEKKQNNLFQTVIWKNMLYNRKETILLIICEMLIVAIAYSGSMCYQILSAKHSSEVLLLQEDGISRQFVYAGMLLLFCAIVLIITVMVSYLGKRIPQYMLLKRMGISMSDTRKMIWTEAGICYVAATFIGFFVGKGLFFIFRKFITDTVSIEGKTGSYSKLTFPVICLFGADTVMYPGTETISALYAAGGASKIWSTYVKYIGAGAIATGGIISLIKSLPLIITTFRDSMKSMKGGKNTSTERTAQDLPMNVILIGIVAMVAIIWLVPAIPVNPIGALIIVIFGFFFATVSSRMVGLVGSSNNPVSGMAIATLLIATFAIKSSGKTGIDGMTAAIAVGSVICIIAAIAGDTSQDLKTGYLLGATPKKQQMGEMLGVVVSGLAIGGVLYLLDAAWGYGTAEIPAPQAQLMKMIVEGIMGGNLPWGLVFVGVFLAICLEILRIPVMPFAIGLYLPIYLNATIMIGGIVRGLLDRRKGVDEKTKTAQATDGTLYCAGMIAGEGLVGILLAIFAVVGISLDMSGVVNLGNIGGVVLMIIMILSLLKFSIWRKKKA